MFVHHVFFWLEEGADLEALREGVESLEAVDEIYSIHIGEAVPSERDVVDDSFDLSLLLVFESKEDHDIYQTHPVHLQFVEECSQLWKRVVVYDAED
ncbi:MAG: Dabb family protein [Bacteroidia bacterium]